MFVVEAAPAPIPAPPAPSYAFSPAELAAIRGAVRGMVAR